MKRVGFAGVLAGIAIVVATTALAADKGSLKVYDPTLVNGTQLSPGDYGLQWVGTGNNVQLKILRGSKVVATASATLVQLKTPARQDMTSTRNAGNSKALTEITFRGKSYALAIAEGPAQASAVASKVDK